MGFVVYHIILLGNILQAAGLQLLIAPPGPHALFKHRSVGGHKFTTTNRAEAITTTSIGKHLDDKLGMRCSAT